MGKEATFQTLILCTILIYKDVFCLITGSEILLQNSTLIRDPLGTKLAMGGMLHALLNIQIRPQGGFYEEKYKDIFPSGGPFDLTESEGGKKQHTTSEMRIYPAHLLQGTSKSPLYEDGKLLEAMSSGKADNPCFEAERISRNRLLSLLCSVRLQRELLKEPE